MHVSQAQVTRKTVSLLSDPDIDVRRSVGASGWLQTQRSEASFQCEAAALLMNLAPHGKIKVPASPEPAARCAAQHQERIVEAGALKPLAKALKDDDEILKDSVQNTGLEPCVKSGMERVRLAITITS